MSSTTTMHHVHHYNNEPCALCKCACVCVCVCVHVRIDLCIKYDVHLITMYNAYVYTHTHTCTCTCAHDIRMEVFTCKCMTQSLFIQTWIVSHHEITRRVHMRICMSVCVTCVHAACTACRMKPQQCSSYTNSLVYRLSHTWQK